jgi:cation/acetate symporter
MAGDQIAVDEAGWSVLEQKEIKGGLTFVKLGNDGKETWWSLSQQDGAYTLNESQSVVVKADGRWINGAPASAANQLRQVGNLEKISGETGVTTGSLSLFEFLAAITDKNTTVRTWKNTSFSDAAGEKVTVYYPSIVSGDRIMRPGLKFKVEGSLLERVDFLSLMLALFLGNCCPAPHPDPLLHRSFTSQRSQIHHRCHCCDRFLLHPHPLHGAGRHGEREHQPG